MKIPYNQVHTNGGIIFAARSGQIHTFGLADGKHISTWKHLDVENVAEAMRKNIADEEKRDLAAEAGEAETTQEAGQEPPAKRQRTVSDDDVSTSKAVETSEGQSGSGTPADGEKKQKKKGKAANQHGKSGRAQSRVPERPIVTHLASTVDGKHLLAISGHDKTIWVFEHDGAGHLSNPTRR